MYNSIPGVPADIEQALTHTVRLTFLHNAAAILYLIGFLIFAVLAIYKPTRSKVLLMLGFLLLLFAFEYQKHIVDALTKQTLVTLNTDIPRYKLQFLIQKTLTRLIPTLSTLGGWAFIIVGILNREKTTTKASKKA